MTATADAIRLHGYPASGTIRLVEFLPWQTPSVSNATAVVSRLVVQTNFLARVPRLDAGRDRLYSSFMAFQELKGGQLVPLGTHHFVEIFHGITRHLEAFPEPVSKKGLQVEMLEDAIALGIDHAALNVHFTAMVDLQARADSFVWPLDGGAYHFRRDTCEELDHKVRALSEKGIVVTLILLNNPSGDPRLDQLLMHPSYDRAGPSRWSAFNTGTSAAARWFIAWIEFLSNRYGQPLGPYGRANNFIVGHPINSHWIEHHMGRAPMETVAADYLRTVRLCQQALRKISLPMRTYVSLDPHWTIRQPALDAQQAFAARPFLEWFAREAKAHGDFEWHVAFHSQPENPFEPRIWLDTNVTTTAATPRVTLKNLEVLPRFLLRTNLLFRQASRRILLFNPGFHTPERPEGEQLQAAAFCYGWYKAKRIRTIDAFILQRQVDGPEETGLRPGLWTRAGESSLRSPPGRKKFLYEIFREADTAKWEEVSRFALPVIGVERWDDILNR